MNPLLLSLSVVILRLIGNRCYCGNTVAEASIPVPTFFCANVCSGNQQSVCGGSHVLSLYEVDKFTLTASPATLLISPNATTNSSNTNPTKPPTPPAPPVVVRVPGWVYKGCYTDSPSDRTLISKKWKGYVTPEKCAEICKGYQFFGLEYSNE